MSGPINLTEVRHAHRRILRATEQATLTAANRAAKFGQQWAIDHARFRHRSGAIKRGMSARVIRYGRATLLIRLRNTAGHAQILEHGSRPHIIRAKRGRALRFFWLRQSRMMFVRSVRHPGTKPYRFLSEARNRAAIEFGSLIERSLRQLTAAMS